MFLLCANWKMNKTPREVKEYFNHFCSLISPKDQKHFVFLAPALSLWQVKESLAKTNCNWGGQNCYFKDQGSFTGENSPLALKQIGANYCLVGHSERRQLFSEDNQMIHKKIKTLWKHSLQPILCVGETKAQKDKGQSLEIVKQQLSLILEDLKNITHPYRLIVAYEPIWAIGSGQIPDPSYIQKMREHIFQLCSEFQIRQNVLFLYGGSVNVDNVQKLFQNCKLDGFLIGGASLNPNQFFELFTQLKNKIND